MKKVLMIAPSCYPVTNSEAIVNIKLLQALSQSDAFEIDLITKRYKGDNYPSDTIESFGVKINSMLIIEVDNKITIKSIIQTIMTYLYCGLAYKGCHWAFPALRVAKKLVKKKKYDYVLTKNSPSFLIGNYLKNKYGIKWVATWNDPYPTVMYPYPYGKGLSRASSDKVQKIVVIMRNADAHIFPNFRIRDYMQKYICVDNAKCFVVPHAIINSLHSPNHLVSPMLRFVHSGNLADPRNPYTFLLALHKFILKHEGAQISFSIMGKKNKDLDRNVKQLNLESYVEYIPPVEYKKGLQQLKQYDVAVIIEADCEEGIFLPTKVSDFMQVSIPIFAVSPAIGILNDLYQGQYIEYFAPVTDVESILSQIEKIYNDFQNDSLNHTLKIREDYLPESIIQTYLNL